MRPRYGVKNSTIGEEWWQDDPKYIEQLKQQVWLDEHCIVLHSTIEGALRDV